MREDGCPVAVTGVACPLRGCLRELRGSLRGAPQVPRNLEIVRLAREGWTTRRLAQRYGISRRHVFRVRRAAAMLATNVEEKAQ